MRDQIIQFTLGNIEIKSKSIVNVHRLNTNNSGDLMCAPYLYFDELKQYNKIDILDHKLYKLTKIINWIKELSENDIVLGGGGLLDRKAFVKSIDFIEILKKKGRKIVPWGVGHNNPLFEASNVFYRQIEGFKIVGIRDYGIPGTDWVPCVSCMNPIFNKDFVIKHDLGIVGH